MRKKKSGSVYRKGGQWVARVRLTDELGRHLERSAKASTKVEAVAKLEQLRRQVIQCPDAPTDIRLGELCDVLLETVYKGRVRSSTFNLYRGLLKNHLGTVREIYSRKLTPAILDELFANPKIGRRTRQLFRRVLIGFLNHAVRLGYVTENVAKKTLSVGGEAKMVEPLTASEVKAILAATQSATLRAAFRTQVELGLRVGELLGIRWDDVNWQAKVITIRQQLLRDRVSGQLDLAPLKTSKSRRTLPITDDLIGILRALPRNGVFVFASTVNGPIDPRNYNRELSIAAKRAGVGHVSSHRLRHSYATWALGLGVDIAIISRAMGHSSITMTARYAAATPEVIRKANQKVAELLE